MRTVAIVQARTGSSRFPRKVLADLLGKPMLVRELERVALARRIDEIVVATTTEPGDDAVADLAAEAGYRVVRGSEDDVLARYAQAAREADAGVVVRITGDCPLIDPALIDAAVAEFADGDGRWDFVSNALSETYPDGMDVEVFSNELLQRADREAELPSEREHVTFWFWKTGRFRVQSISSPEPLGSLRLTVDYPEDLEVVRQVYEKLAGADPAFGLAQIVDAVRELGDLANAEIGRNTGWDAALARDAAADPETPTS